MGWKGTIHSINAHVNRMERESQRRQRELQRQQAAAEKAAEIEQAAYEVVVYENQIELLTTVHTEHSQEVDWQQLKDQPKPERPIPTTERQQDAKTRREGYRPGRLAQSVGLAKKRQAKLEQELAEAKAQDRVESEERIKEFESAHADWKQTQELAASILNGDPQSMMDAIEEIDPFSDISELGSSVTLTATDDGKVTAVIHVNAEEAIPKQIKTQLKSGKLSVKDMPKTKFYELYQDHVCSCVLRVGTELLALLPVGAVLVTAVTPLLNTATGHMEEQAILSALLPRLTVNGLNLAAIDPSDSMANFTHKMNFKKTKGFEPVEPLTPSDFSDRS